MADCTDTRKGYSFCNPDLTANDGWGAIITPDELRYIYAFGNDLVSPDGHTITDCNLQDFITNAIGAVERDLNVTLIKKIVKHRPYSVNGVEQERELNGVAGLDYIWEEPYDYDPKQFNEFMYIKLRKRPVIKINNIEFRDPTGNLIASINSWKKVNFEMGSIEFFPHQGALMNLPMVTGSSFYGQPYRFVNNRYPDAFYIDYEAGFENSAVLKKQWPELFSIIGKVAAIDMLNVYGDGKTSAVASSSLGLDGISESISTTLSATSAAFGARILQYSKEIQDFYKRNKYKYAGLQIGAL